jgi:membrane protease YdiL (CAAX protease family)
MGQHSVIVSTFEILKQINVKTKIFLYFGVLLAITIPFWILGSVTHIHGLPFNMQLNVLLVFAIPFVTLYFIARERGFASLRQVAIDCLPGHRASSLGIAVAFLTLPLVAVLTFFITHFFVAFDGWSISFFLAPVYFVVYYIAAAFEEIGWTWYATPLLGKSMNVVSTGIIIGAVWATVHTLPWFQQGGPWFMARV